MTVKVKWEEIQPLVQAGYRLSTILWLKGLHPYDRPIGKEKDALNRRGKEKDNAVQTSK